MRMATFTDIDLSEYDTDKSRSYLDFYGAELGHLTSEPIRLLELGVRRGGSLLLWRDLFPHAQIAGLDITPVTVPDETGRVRSYVGFQQDEVILDRIAAEVAPGGFDVIIDDASHIGQYTAASFWHLFTRHLKPGGLYVLEDWSCGYWPEWPDGHEYSGDPAAVGAPRTTETQVASGRVEHLHRRLRAAAPRVSARVESMPRLKSALRVFYTKVEGASVQRRFQSHDYGMVGFVKQLVDACAVDVMRNSSSTVDGDVLRGQIQFVKIAPSQVFVRKIVASL